MDCSELAANLADFIDGSLSPEDEAAAIEHLATCTECEAVLAGTRQRRASSASRHAKVDLTSVERADLLSKILAADGDPPEATSRPHHLARDELSGWRL